LRLASEDVEFLHWLQELSTSPNSSRGLEVLSDVKTADGLLAIVAPEKLLLLGFIIFNKHKAWDILQLINGVRECQRKDEQEICDKAHSYTSVLPLLAICETPHLPTLTELHYRKAPASLHQEHESLAVAKTCPQAWLVLLS
jgi:hypothetical protein